MVAFYNQADQDIYTGGDHFIPQKQYRLGNFNTTVPTTETQQVNQGYGIPYTGAFTNSNINRDNSNTGGYGTWGNLDESTRKDFNIDGNIVRGYKNLNSGLYQDYEGLNIQNLGLGKKEEDAEYPGLFHNVSFKSMLKNPGLVKQFFNRQDIEKQAELQKEIDAENRKASYQAAYDTSVASGRTPGGWYGGDDYSEGLAGNVSQAGPGRQEEPGGGAFGKAQGGRIGFRLGAAATGGMKGTSDRGMSTGDVSGGKGDNGHPDRGWQNYAIGPTPDTTDDSGGIKKKLNISPFINTVDHTPVELGAVSNTKLGRLKAMIDFRNLNKALTYGKEDDTVVNSLDDVKNLLDPSFSFNTQIGPVDVNAYKDKDIDYYGVGTNLGPVNLGYQDINSQKRADISYAPNDNFNFGATTDFNNIDFGASYNPEGPLSVNATYNPTTGTWETTAGLTWNYNNGGLVSIL